MGSDASKPAALIVFAVFGVVGLRTTHAAPGDILNLGKLDGGSSNASAINDAGQVAGSADTISGEVEGSHAFRYSGLPGAGAMADLGTLGGTSSFGRAINLAGDVVGYACTPDDSALRAFLYSGTPGLGGAMIDLGTLGGTNSFGHAINDAGQIAGYAQTSGDAVAHAFRYTGIPGFGGAMADLGTLGGTTSAGYAINNAGQVAGQSFITGNAAQHAFRYTGTPGSGGAMADLGTLGGTESIAWSINNAGQVTGYAKTTGDAAQHAFRYTGTPGAGGVMADLGPGVGNGINDAGFVVGEAGSLATLWLMDSANTAVDLDAWLDATNPAFGAYWQLRAASDINNNGLIAGLGYYDDGAGGLSDGFRSYILDASSLVVPEPTGVALLGLGLPVLFRRRARRAAQSSLIESLEPRRLLSFSAGVDYPISNYAVGVESADFNGDGRPDIASVSGADLAVLLATASGTFVYGNGMSIGGVSLALAAGDFNGDGKTDLVIAKEAAPPTMVLGNGDGSFGAPSVVPISFPQIPPDEALSYYYMTDIVVADANGDGKPDALFSGEVRTIAGDSMNFYPYAAVSLGRGDGTFGPLYGDYDSRWGYDLAADDVNGDGKVDMIWNTLVRLGTGNGTFAAGQEIVYPGFPGGALTVDDFNGDGKRDIASSGGYVALGNGNGTFQPALSYGAGTNPRSIEAADFNGDGKQDLVNVYRGEWFNTIAPIVTLRLGIGNGSFAAPVTLSTAPQSEGFSDVTVGDFNSDGRPDIAFAHYFTMRVLLNDGNWATKTYVGPATGGNWSTAANWSPSGVPTASDLVTISGKAVNLSASVTVRSLNLTAGATLTLSAGGNRVLRASSLSISADSTVDLTNNDLILDYSAVSPVGVWTGSAYDGVTGMIQSGRIISSLASGNLKTLGVTEAREALGISGSQTATFAGQAVDSTSVLVKITWGGDATLDGKINIDDYGRIDGNVAQSGSVFGWFSGDFNYDGKINIDDYGIIDGNISQQQSQGL